MKKGLKFPPTPKSNTSELKTDIKEFCRKLRLSERFYKPDDDHEHQEIPLVRNKKVWQPPKSEDKLLEQTIQTLHEFPLEHSKNVKSNLTNRERNAMESLKSDKSLIIKEADKGGAVVCIDSDYYRDKLLDMLSEEEFYEQTERDADNYTRKLIRELVDLYGGGLHCEEQDYLTNFDHITSNFYGLTKVHKSNLISAAIAQQNSEYIVIHRPEDLKFGPIVGGPNSSTQRLSHFLDILLKPLCREVSKFCER